MAEIICGWGEDRRILYFDAYHSRPPTRPYHESRNVRTLLGAALGAFLDAPNNSKTVPLASTRTRADLSARTRV